MQILFSFIYVRVIPSTFQLLYFVILTHKTAMYPLMNGVLYESERNKYIV